MDNNAEELIEMRIKIFDEACRRVREAASVEGDISWVVTHKTLQNNIFFLINSITHILLFLIFFVFFRSLTMLSMLFVLWENKMNYLSKYK